MDERRRFSRVFGARVRERRLYRDLTLQALADLAGVSKGWVSHIENGRCQPTAMSLQKLARALGVTADSLLTGES
jgi:transcriptional regulator with XRE-family HTH domain